jgi:two-component system, LuxR family, response regulator FixJ
LGSNQGASRPRIEASILVVDDDDAVRESLRLVLETQGYRVVEFSNAMTFVDKADWQTACCVVLDLNLPGMTGLEALSDIRARGAAAPVIVMAAGISREVAARAHQLGVAGVFEKPVAGSQLLAAIAALADPALDIAETPE